MDTSMQAAEQRIKDAYEYRMAALQKWYYDEPGSETCPCCFGTWISVHFDNGWEYLCCCECKAKGPLPAQKQARKLEKTRVLGARIRARIRDPNRIPSYERRHAANLNVAW